MIDKEINKTTLLEALADKRKISLDIKSVDSFYGIYIKLVEEIIYPTHSGNIVNDFLEIKRKKVNAGPYPNVSFFECANRICSDLTLLYGCKSLLKSSSDIALLKCCFGTVQGPDIVAFCKEEKIIFEAEVFCTSEKFFRAKFYQEKHKKSTIIYQTILSKEIEGFISKNFGHKFIAVDITSDWSN